MRQTRPENRREQVPQRPHVPRAAAGYGSVLDLVGSTELAHRMDPEDLRELNSRLSGAVAGVVARYGGYVANFLGDGIVAYFGWPRADEDQAVQAVRAGLAVVAAVRLVKVERAPQLQARAGIASGQVVVGDLQSAGAKQAGVISGETPNLAARIQAAADEDQVVIAGLTRQLIGAAFELDKLGDKTLKGFVGPCLLWRVLRERSLETRFEARGGQLTAFVGREHEVALLLERWQRVVAGKDSLSCCRARLASANLALCSRYANVSPRRRIVVCVSSAPPTTRPARSTH